MFKDREPSEGLTAIMTRMAMKPRISVFMPVWTDPLTRKHHLKAAHIVMQTGSYLKDRGKKFIFDSCNLN